MVQNDAFDLQARVAEVEQQANVQAGGAKVIDALGAMEVGDGPGRLKLNDHLVLDHKVRRILPNNHPIIDDDDAALLRDREVSLAKLMSERTSYTRSLNPAPRECPGITKSGRAVGAPLSSWPAKAGHPRLAVLPTEKSWTARLRRP